MGLSNDIISQFVKITNDNKQTTKKETITYGKVFDVGEDGRPLVILDGTLTDENGNTASIPVSTTVSVNKNDRVIVMIKNHSAVITGNLGNPAVNKAHIAGIEETADAAKTAAKEASTKITEFDILLGEKLDTKDFNAEIAKINKLEADTLLTQTVLANKQSVQQLTAEDVKITGLLEVQDAAVKSLQSDQAKFEEVTAENFTATNAKIANFEADHSAFKQATAQNFEADRAEIAELKTNKLSAESADVRYAKIDFANIDEAAITKIFSEAGIIENLTVKDGTITGKLVGVTISGDLIEGNTVKADKLVVKGSDGIYYKLNIDAGATTSEKVTEADLQNGLHGTAIIAKTITAEKISVSDLVAFGATIGGFNISTESIYSGVKSSVDNTTQGIYLDKTGQINIGDSSNFIKYYKDQNGNYKLVISAENVVLATSGKSVQTTIDELEIGGVNLIKNSNFANGIDKWVPVGVAYTIGTDDKHGSYIKITSTAVGGSEHRIYPETVSNFTHSKGTFTVSFYAKTDVSCTLQTNIAGGTTGVKNYQLTTAWTKFVHTYECNGSGSLTFWLNDANTTAYITKIKLEHGDKATDWSLAPEDMATSEDVKKAQSAADEARSISDEANALIAQLSESISMLVTDTNGASLMIQTDSGWTFSTAEIQAIVNTTSEGLNDLIKELGDTNSAVDILQQAVSDLGAIAEYVNIGVYEDEPCIELGEGDSDFKLRITNTRMMFTEGATILAYFNNQSFYVRKAVVEEELQQGGFVWKVRSNGNLGLVWKGGNN